MSTQTPREIAFDDIRKGDDIEVQWRMGDALETRRGVAHEWGGDFWGTRGGRVLVDRLDRLDRILLHHRPVSAEPEGLGATMRSEGIEYVSVNRKPGTPRWVDAGLHEGGTPWAVRWDEFDPDSIEVLSEGNEVDQ